MKNIKQIIISSCVVLVIIIVTVCASYYIVTKYNIDKENKEALQKLNNNGIVVESD